MKKNWFYIEMGERVGPITEADLQKLYASGRILETTLIRNYSMDEWEPFSKQFGHLPKPPPTTPLDDAERVFQPDVPEGKAVARVDISALRAAGSGATVTCSACKKVWASNLCVALRKQWICLGCKAKIDEEAAKRFRMLVPFYQLPIFRAIAGICTVVVLAFVGYALYAILALHRTVFPFSLQPGVTLVVVPGQSVPSSPQGVAPVTPGGTPAPVVEFYSPGTTQQVALWGGVPGATFAHENWFRLAREDWPQLVGQIALFIGTQREVLTQGFVIDSGPLGKLAVAAIEGLPVDLQDALHAQASTPVILKGEWSLLGAPPVLKPATAANPPAGNSTVVAPPLPPAPVPTSIRVQGILGLPKDYNERDSLFFELQTPFGPTAQPLASLRLRITPLASSEPIFVPIATVEGGKLTQRIVRGRVVSITNQGRKCQAYLESSADLRALRGSPILDYGGFVVGVVIGSTDVEQDGRTLWVVGETVPSLVRFLEKQLHPDDFQEKTQPAKTR